MRKLGPINCLDVVQDPAAPWVVLFHGFGADANDLLGLADIIPTKKPCNYLFPQGPFEVPIGPGWTGRAWWPLDLERLQREMEAGADRDIAGESPAALPDVRAKVMKMLGAMNVPWNRVVLGGFSQGGMLAVDLAMHAPEAPAGLVLLSSALVNKDALKPLTAGRAGLPFFQSHGQSDGVLSFKNAQRLESFLVQSGLKGKLMAFNGAHEIPPQTIQQLGHWLDDRLEKIP